jgi:hypothetical protein
MLCVKCVCDRARAKEIKKGISEKPQFCNEIWFLVAWRSQKTVIEKEISSQTIQKRKEVKWKFIKNRESLKGNARKHLLKGNKLDC